MATPMDADYTCSTRRVASALSVAPDLMKSQPDDFGGVLG